MAKVLTTDDVIQMMAEEYKKHLQSLTEIEIFSKDRKKIIIAPGLKVRHGKSKLLYTLDSIGPTSVILRTPDGKEITVDHDEFESEYDLD